MNLKTTPHNKTPSITAPKSTTNNNTGATKPSTLDRVSKYFPNQPGISAPNGILVAYPNKKV